MPHDFVFQGPPSSNIVAPGTTLAPADGIDTVNNVEYVSTGAGWKPAVPATVGSTNLVNQSAAVAATTVYAVPAHMSGMYRISVVAKVTTAATTSSNLGAITVNYTDNVDGVAVSGLSAAALSAGNTTGTQINGSVIVNAKGGTNIQWAIAYTSVGATSMVYAAEVRVDYLG